MTAVSVVSPSPPVSRHPVLPGPAYRPAYPRLIDARCNWMRATPAIYCNHDEDVVGSK